MAILAGAAPAARGDDAGESPGPAARADDPGESPRGPTTPAGTVAIRGSVIGKLDRLPAAGATLVAAGSGDGATAEAVAITDEHGRYELRVTPGVYTIVAYYLDGTTLVTTRTPIAADTELGPHTVEPSSSDTGCVLFTWPDPALETDPRFGLTVRRDHAPVSRDRTHRAWIVPVVAADARTAVTTLESGARLAGAPGIPLAFVEEVQTHTLRVPIALPAGAGGAADVSLRHGRNTPSGDVRLALGLDRLQGLMGVEGLAGGPLLEDKAWVAAGLAADRDARGARGTHGMLAIQYAAAFEHRLSVVGLTQATAGGARDRWASARWISRLLESRLDLQAIATAEQLADPSAEAIARMTGAGAGATGELLSRIGGRLAATWRRRGLGYHTVSLSAGGGAGWRDRDRDRDRHTDGSFAAGHTWDLRANLRLDAGVRREIRTFGDDRAAVTAPRASLTYDFTREGRADAFVAYQRVPHLDDAAPGRWRGQDALAHDELAAGVGYSPEPVSSIMIGAAARARRAAGEAAEAEAAAAARELGLEAWVRYLRRRTHLHAAATTLDRAASLHVQRELLDRRRDGLLAGATVRATPDGTSGGASLRWRHTAGAGRGLSLDVALEAYAGADGPGGRLAAGAAW